MMWIDSGAVKMSLRHGSMAMCLMMLMHAESLMAQRSWRFVCAPAGASSHDVSLTANSVYKAPAVKADPKLPAYGFDLGTLPSSFSGAACSAEKPFFFSLAVPDGNYRVTLALGGPQRSTMTVRAESRRLFVDQLVLSPGASESVVFNVNVRTAAIVTPSTAPTQVKLKPREIGALDWDEKLTLEFNGDHPAVRSIEIRADESVPTIYIAGDSTVVDQDKEPWAAWGQMLPVFFGSSVSIANEAESGETIHSFVGERRLEKIMSTIRAGDTLMIQFGHNDQKAGAGYVPAATDFKTFLLRYIAESEAHGAHPILVTPMNRRNFGADGKVVPTLGDYPAVMRAVAAEQHVPLIDLNAMSKTLYEALGEEGTLHAFVHYPANTFPGQTEALKDDTHFNSYGAYELARAIVQDIRNQHLALARDLKPGMTTFDPAHPDAFDAWKLPLSPAVSTDTPYGR